MNFSHSGFFRAWPKISFWAMTSFSLLTATLTLTSVAVASDTPFKPVVVFQGEMQTGSYLHIINSGIQRFEQKTGVKVHRIHLKADSNQYVEELKKAAESGYTPLIVHDSNNLKSFPSLAKQYPSTHFISLDVAYHVPNILGLTFNHAEGAYVIGYLAGLKTKSNKLGFVGGLDIPVINNFRCGYEIGAKDANPNVTFDIQYVNNGAYSWDNTATAKELTNKILAQGADIVFPVTGYASLGVMEAVKMHGSSYSFGVDNDFSDIYPHSSIASLEKRVDIAVFASLMQLNKGIWNGNQKHFGIKQGVISISLNDNNPDLTESEKERAQQLLIDLKGKSSLISQRIDQYCSVSL